MHVACIVYICWRQHGTIGRVAAGCMGAPHLQARADCSRKRCRRPSPNASNSSSNSISPAALRPRAAEGCKHRRLRRRQAAGRAACSSGGRRRLDRANICAEGPYRLTPFRAPTHTEQTPTATPHLTVEKSSSSSATYRLGSPPHRSTYGPEESARMARQGVRWAGGSVRAWSAPAAAADGVLALGVPPPLPQPPQAQASAPAPQSSACSPG